MKKGSRVADVGTDHGYLPIYLLQKDIASSVLACDLREQPLASAKANAERFGITKRIAFRLSDGLSSVAPDEFDTLVCAGMGGDLIEMILRDAPYLRSGDYTLILQPQSACPALRSYLVSNGFAVREEKLLKEGRFFYTVMRCEKGESAPLSPGQQYLPPWLEKNDLLPDFAARQEQLLKITVEGLRSAEHQRPEKLSYFETAFSEVRKMRKML